jgi:hypothetical protein
MTLDQMNADLARYSDFEQLSDRVGYWSRRFALTKPTQAHTDTFDGIVAKHSMRALSVLRAG